jgi:hypothetical protein
MILTLFCQQLFYFCLYVSMLAIFWYLFTVNAKVGVTTIIVNIIRLL